MNSPTHTDPGSHSSEESDAEEILAQTQQVAVPVHGGSGGASGKRRLQSGGSHVLNAGSGAGRPRPREEGTKRRNVGGALWSEHSGREGSIRMQRDELVDMHVVEKLRQDWGDPFAKPLPKEEDVIVPDA